jgi:hypothetical protein
MLTAEAEGAMEREKPQHLQLLLQRRQLHLSPSMAMLQKQPLLF